MWKVSRSLPSPSANSSLFDIKSLGIFVRRRIGAKTQGVKMIISGVDLLTQEKRLGRRALSTRKWFAENGPADAPRLPIWYDEREALKHGGIDHLVAWYGCSVACQDFNIEQHPSFHDYACGLMASDFTPYFIKEDEELRKRFPPRPLNGLGPALDWEPPVQHAQTMSSYRRSKASWCRLTTAERTARSLSATSTRYGEPTQPIQQKPVQRVQKPFSRIINADTQRTWHFADICDAR
jgi:hypothetical protein